MPQKFRSPESILAAAASDNRNFLFEYETYELLRSAGITSVPHFRLISDPGELTDEVLNEFDGKKIVLKVVSEDIAHKTDVGGVKILPKEIREIENGLASMLDTVPGAYLDWLNGSGIPLPDKYAHTPETELVEEVRKNIRGIMLTEFVEAEATGFGYEMLAGLRWTREFGPVITLGLGGVDTELYAKVMKPGHATVSFSPLTMSAEESLTIYKQTTAYKKASGATRGGKRVVTDIALMECFQALIDLAGEFGPDGESRFEIHELEINPFIYAQNEPVPLDGLCRFERRRSIQETAPTHKIRNLLHPESIAVIGVSSKKLNMGRIILRNVIQKNFPKEELFIIRPGIDRIDEIKCVPTIAELPKKVDVLVLAVDAAQAPEIITQAAASGKVESVIIIPGGLGEKSGTEKIVKGMNAAISKSRFQADKGPIFIGGNCLGILSRPGNYDTLFVPDQKLPKNYDKSPDPVAFLSQSGARMITVMSQHSDLAPLFAISTGNQMDIGISDILAFMAENEPDVRVFSVYIEGFRDLGGLKMIRTVKQLAAQNRDVIFYKAGRTPAGKTATSGHTASVAGDYQITAQLLESAGALVCTDFTEFNELTRLAVALKDKNITGNHIAAISNAGYESVGMADNVGEISGLHLTRYSAETRDRIRTILEKGRIDKLVDIRNPMDVTPMADDDVHEQIVRAQLADPNVHCVIAATVPLSPTQQTLPSGVFGKEDIEHDDSYPNRMIRCFRDSDKPMISVIDSGKLYDPLVAKMEAAGLITFRTADLALRILGKYITGKLRAQKVR